MRYTVDVDATRAAATAPPPTVSGYTPDWGKPYGFWKTLGLGAAIYVITLYGSFLASTTIEMALLPLLSARAERIISSVPSPESLTDELLAALLTDELPAAVYTCVTGILGSLLIGLVVFHSNAPARTFFGTGKLRLRQTTVYVLAIAIWFVLVVSFIALLRHFTGWTAPEGWRTNYRNAELIPLVGLGTVLLGPLFEELLYRGFLFSGIRKSRLGINGAVIFTAFLFAVTHYRYGAFGVSMVFVFGLLLGVARHRSDTTSLPFLMHATWNLLSLTSWAILTRIV